MVKLKFTQHDCEHLRDITGNLISNYPHKIFLKNIRHIFYPMYIEGCRECYEGYRACMWRVECVVCVKHAAGHAKNSGVLHASLNI